MSFNILACPNCKSNIPLFKQFYLNNKQVPYITLKCTCSKGVLMTISLDNYLNIIKVKQCAKHKQIENIICVKCALKFCRMCYKNHLIKYPLHTENFTNVLTKNYIKTEEFRAQWDQSNKIISDIVDNFENNQKKQKNTVNDLIVRIDEIINDFQIFKERVLENYLVYKRNEPIINEFLSALKFNIQKSEFNMNENLLQNMLKIKKIINEKEMEFNQQIEKVKVELDNTEKSLLKINCFKVLEHIFNNCIPINFLKLRQMTKIPILYLFPRPKIKISSNKIYSFIIPFYSNDDVTYSCFIQLNNKSIAFAGSDSIIRILSKSKQLELKASSCQASFLLQLSDSLIASGHIDGSINIWDISLFKCINKFIAHKSQITCLIKIPDDLIGSSSFDSTIKIWNSKSFTIIYTFTNALSGPIDSIVLLSGKRIIASTGGRYMKILSYKLMKWVVSYEEEQNIYLIKKIKDDLICCCLLDGKMGIWDMKENKKIFILKGHKNFVTSIGYNNANNLLISCNMDSIIKVWDLNSRQCCTTIYMGLMCATLTILENENVIVGGYKGIKLLI